jgi:hypothetical protein
VQRFSFSLLQFNRDTIFSQRNSGTNNQWTGKHHDQLSVLRQNQTKGRLRGARNFPNENDWGGLRIVRRFAAAS